MRRAGRSFARWQKKFPAVWSTLLSHHIQPPPPGLLVQLISASILFSHIQLLINFFSGKRVCSHCSLTCAIYELDAALTQSSWVLVQDDSKSFATHSSPRSASEAYQTLSAFELQEWGSVGTDGSVKHTCVALLFRAEDQKLTRHHSVPSRLLALKYGADLVWGPETVDKAIIGCERAVDSELQIFQSLIPS